MTRATPRQRGDYAAFETVQTRWNDNDQFGHIYNATYYELFDCAMNNWMVPRGLLNPAGPDPIAVVVENGCTYFHEVAYPDPIGIGLRIGHLGNSSLVLEMGLFRDGDDAECAQSRFVLVCVDAQTRRPLPFPDDQRRILSALQIGG